MSHPSASYIPGCLEDGGRSCIGVNAARHLPSGKPHPAPAIKTGQLRAALAQQAAMATAAAAGSAGGGSASEGSSRCLGAPPGPVVILHNPSSPEMVCSDKRLRVSLDVERVWACLTADGGPAFPVNTGLPTGPHGPASLPGDGGGVPARADDGRPSGMSEQADPSHLLPYPMPEQSGGGAAAGRGGGTSYDTAPLPALRARAAEPAAAPTELMTFDEGLPPFWSDPRQLGEARRLLLSAAELVWAPLSQSGHSSGGTCGTGGTGVADSILRSFLCGQAAGCAITTGIKYHMQQLSSEVMAAGQMGGGGVAVRHEPESFVALLAVAGKHAFDAWEQHDHSSGGGGGPGRSSSELLARCGGSAERAMEEAVWEWQQEQQASQGGAAPLLQLVTTAGEGGGGGGSRGAAPMVLVRLDVAGLLDLASSIRLAEELAMELLI